MYQCSTLQGDFKQQKNNNRDRFPVGLRIDIKSIKRKQMERIEIHLSKIKMDAIYENTNAANKTKIKILRIILLDLTPVQI